MDIRSEKGSIRSRLLVFLPVLALIGIVGFALAESSDPCAIYPKQSARISGTAPTQSLVAGVLGKQIYVCSVEVAQYAGATPGLTLSYGEAVASTPCATATPGAVLGVIGANATTTTYGNGNSTIFGPVPAGSSTPYPDLCGLGASITGGSI